MFINRTETIIGNRVQLNYGAAVTDIDGDGHFEIIVTGYGFPNTVLKWMGDGLHDITPPELADFERMSIGVAAGDLDADGREEIYILNADTFGGRKRFGDRLFAHNGRRFIDLFAQKSNLLVANMVAGRSVAVVDRLGTGRYSFYIANYGGPTRFYELDDDGHLVDVAQDAGVAYTAGGRSLLAAPLISNFMDIYAGNENGPNYLFRNRGDGTFDEIGQLIGLDDPFQHARGMAVLDGGGRFDLVIGNWEGFHRLYRNHPKGRWLEITPLLMAEPSRVRTVIAADFDNDGYEEIFFHNMGQANRLFSQVNGSWQAVSPGDALEPGGYGTGAVVGDFDEDGWLELMLTHGEANAQPMTLYKAEPNSHHWLRVLPLTAFGAPARGAIVRLRAGERTQQRAIDAGSGYLCQMEPVAHFGLGELTSTEYVEVIWPDGTKLQLATPAVDQLLRVPYPE